MAGPNGARKHWRVDEKVVATDSGFFTKADAIQGREDSQRCSCIQTEGWYDTAAAQATGDHGKDRPERQVVAEPEVRLVIDTPHIVQADAQFTAVIRFAISREELKFVMAAAITEVIETVTAQEVGPAGPVFVHHLSIAPDRLEFEVGVPISSPFAPTGRVVPSHLPAASVARTIYYGSYDGLSDAWAWFGRWIAAERYTAAQDLWEVYLVGPEASPNPIYWRTELNRPLKNPADRTH